ncbi:hypothetical protein GPA_34950 [Gordonibacter pamelaeae 7-10-1-b]|uniref:Uncharacterized protein n=1 Tax=Gordonibacter pamelaeae 7-10-1-b TaxID=657308 RepID=D6EBV3_9ACTN|nr:hypothetical protein GPA_34950 [Gordonibacter pamelaeae 7-10-1-b]
MHTPLMHLAENSVVVHDME